MRFGSTFSGFITGSIAASVLYSAVVLPSHGQDIHIERYTGPGAALWEEFVRIRMGGEVSVDPGPAQVHSPSSVGASRPPPGTVGELATQASEASGPRAPIEDGPVYEGNLEEAIVYVRVPRTIGRHQVELKNDEPYTLHSPDVWDRLPDSRHVFEGFNAPGQLIYRDADGGERILYDCVLRNDPCVPLDPMVSFDGRRILFSVYWGKRLKNASWDGTTLPNRWLDQATEARLHVVDIATGKVTPLKHEPGVFDVSPAWLPDGRILFASSRARFREPWLDGITPNRRVETQLYIADEQGGNAVNISPHEVTTAMHPYVLRNGRIAYSSHWLSHNLAYGSTNGSINWPGTLDNMWLVMDMDVRGGDMHALLGAHRNTFKSASGRTKTMKALHFLGQRYNSDICVSNYYRGNNLGLGDVFCWTPEPVGVEGALPEFLPRNLYNVANWSKSNDEPSVKQDGLYQGKIGYPEGMPGNQLLLTVGRGFCTNVSGTVKSFQERVAEQPHQRGCDVGVYHTTRIPSRQMSDMVRVVDREEWHEFGARVVVARSAPDAPDLRYTNDGSCQLVSSDAGTAETSASRPYAFNNNYKSMANNGGEVHGLPHSELAAIRFWEVLPNKKERRAFKNSIGNQLRLLGDVPLLRDKSFKVELPCDTPYVMAGLDRMGRVIKRDQVPQSLRPGEKRVCTGCHLHSKSGRSYEESLAFTAQAEVLLDSRPVPTYARDIKPIFERRCQTCHVADLPLMDYDALVWDQFQASVPEDRRVLMRESDNERRRWGIQRPYTSKYVNSMFARESLLYWKAANQRTDGRTDTTYPDDIDFGLNHPVSITATELRTLAEWLDSGAGALE
tara:strand:- start:21451 stop:23982 length:2532 start_codon:yes stop_codon:yes gene_type:complete